MHALAIEKVHLLWQMTLLGNRVEYFHIPLPGSFPAAYQQVTAGNHCLVPFAEAMKMNELKLKEEPETAVE